MRKMLLQNPTAILLQNATQVITKYVRVFITKCDSFITKCNSYYKMRQFYYKLRRLLQFATVQIPRILKTNLSLEKSVLRKASIYKLSDRLFRGHSIITSR